MMKAHQDSTGRPIGVGDRVRWRGQIYTIKSFDDSRHSSRTIVFEEPVHIADEIPDEIAVDLVEEVAMTGLPSPSTWWRRWR